MSSTTIGHFEVVLEQTGSVLCRTALWYCFKERIDVVRDTRQICMRFWTDGIKVMSRGISECKQVIKFTNTKYRGQSERNLDNVPQTVSQSNSDPFRRRRPNVRFNLCITVNSRLIQLRKGFALGGLIKSRGSQCFDTSYIAVLIKLLCEFDCFCKLQNISTHAKEGPIFRGSVLTHDQQHF